MSVFSGDVSAASDLPAAVDGRFTGSHVLVPLLAPRDEAVSLDQLAIARSLAGSKGTVSITPAPRSHDGDVIRSDQADDADIPGDAGIGARGYPGSLVGAVLRTVRRESVDTLVLPSATSAGRLRTGVVDRIATHANSDVIVVNGRAGYGRVASILLPIAGGPHSALAAEVSAAIAERSEAWIDLIHVLEPNHVPAERDRAEQLLTESAARIARPATTTTRIVDAPDVGAAIVNQTRCYDLTVIGAPTKGRLRRLFDGSTNRAIRANAGSVVLSVRDNRSRHG